MGLFDKLFKKQPDPDPVKKEKPAATPPPAPEVKKRTSWLDELADPDSGVHEALAKLAEPPARAGKSSASWCAQSLGLWQARWSSWLLLKL